MARSPSNHARAARWNDLAAWTHSWDANDAVTYTPNGTDQSNYGIDSSTRVSSVPDRGTGALDLKRDQGIHSSAFSLPSFIPGPLYIASSAFHRGRSAMRFDVTPAHNTIHSMLTPIRDFTDNTSWFNPPNGYAAPYWVALFGDGHDCTLGSDGTGPTLGGGIAGPALTLWSAACWNLNVNPIPFYINTTHTVSATETAIVLYYNSGNGTGSSDSFLEVNWRDTSGVIQTTRQTGAQENWPFKEDFFGWVDNHGYLSACGIKLGTPTETELSAVRNFAAAYLPNTGSGG